MAESEDLDLEELKAAEQEAMPGRPEGESPDTEDVSSPDSGDAPAPYDAPVDAISEESDTPADDADGDPAPEESGVSSLVKDLEAVYDIPVQVSAVLGTATIQVSQLLKLGRGAVVELDSKVGEAIDIYVNNRLVARGEVVVVDDRLGVTMTEIIKTDRTVK